MTTRIYLDNAATSFPKPDAVYQAVDRYQRELGTAVGRGSSRAAGEVQRGVDQCRLRAARLFGASRPEQVLFTSSGTDSLNIAIQGLLNQGDRVVTTVWDHNSVLRPLAELQAQGRVEAEVVAGNDQGTVDLEALESALKKSTKLVVVTHASNVTGIVQPVREVVRLAHAAGALVLLDAAQTAGHLPIDLRELDVDIIACPGHKGLLGPLGTGLLVLKSGIEQQMRPLRYGGTGTTSELDRQPDALPERFEPGNHNAPGLFGLNASLEWLQNRQQSSQENEFTSQLISGLQELSQVRVHLGEPHLTRVGVVSVSVDRTTPQVLATLLDEHFQIETRAGLHCAPKAHATLNTLQDGGTVRFSVGPFTTQSDIDATLEAVAQIAMAM